MISALKFHHAKKFINPIRLSRNITFSNRVNKNRDIKLNKEVQKEFGNRVNITYREQIQIDWRVNMKVIKTFVSITLMSLTGLVFGQSQSFRCNFSDGMNTNFDSGRPSTKKSNDIG